MWIIFLLLNNIASLGKLLMCFQYDGALNVHVIRQLASLFFDYKNMIRMLCNMQAHGKRRLLLIIWNWLINRIIPNLERIFCVIPRIIRIYFVINNTLRLKQRPINDFPRKLASIEKLLIENCENKWVTEN